MGGFGTLCWMFWYSRNALPSWTRLLLQGYLVHKEHPPPEDPTEGLPGFLWWSGGGGAVSQERGTPAAPPTHHTPCASKQLLASFASQESAIS